MPVYSLVEVKEIELINFHYPLLLTLFPQFIYTRGYNNL